MSETPKPAASEARSADDPSNEAERKRKLAKVFGDVLPEATADDRSDSWGEGDSASTADDWYRRQVPPHHGG